MYSPLKRPFNTAKALAESLVEVILTNFSEVSSRLFLQMLIPNDEKNAVATLDIADKIVTEIPAYLLRCDISEEAVEKSFEALTGLRFCEKKNKINS